MLLSKSLIRNENSIIDSISSFEAYLFHSMHMFHSMHICFIRCISVLFDAYLFYSMQLCLSIQQRA